MERPRKRGRPPGSKNKPKDSKQSKHYNQNRPNATIPSKRNKGTASVDSDEDTRVVAPPRNPRHRRSSKTTTLEPSKKRKQTSDDDGDVSDESPVERRTAKRARQANRSSDEEEHDSEDNPSTEEQIDVDRAVEDMDDEDSNSGSDMDYGDDSSSSDDTTSQQSQASNHLSPGPTMEERRVLIPPKKATANSEGNWEYEYELPENLMQRDGVDDNYKNAVVFNYDWTEEDEEQLWKTWTKADALVLNKLEPGERAVWRKVKHLFDIPAPEVIPPFLKVNPQHLRPVQVEVKSRRAPYGEKVYLEHVNWGQGFCTLLVKILCTPAFSKDLAFLRYVLQYAVHFRVGEDEEKCPRPREEDFFNDGDDYFSFVNATADDEGMERVPEKYARLINDTFSAKVRPKYHPHMKLIKDFRLVVPRIKKKKADYLGIINLDLQHIVDAWNLRYILRKRNFGGLKTMEECQRAYEKSGHSDKRKLPEGEIKRTIQIANDRRNWIMSCRRKQAIREKQNSHLGSPLLASEIDEQDVECKVEEEHIDNEKDVVETEHAPGTPLHLRISSSPETHETPPVNQSPNSLEVSPRSSPELSPELIPQLIARSSSSSPKGGLVKGHWNLWTSAFILDELENRSP
jgi:hypothetical protein